jgi:monofunctional biosynthetic peptidoglycan transglycosylase
MLKRRILAGVLALIGAFWFYYVTLPWPLLLRVRDPNTTALMKQRVAEARARGESLEIQQTWVPLDDISRRLRRAVIVGEDGRFYEHDGVDWDALREEFRYRGDADFSWFDPGDLRALFGAAMYYRENRATIRGRSTITQQLAKNLYFSTERSPLRKVDEFLVARRLERFLAKDRILEVYLNIVEWGPGIFGAEAAAQEYFDRSASDLTAAQAAALAATLPHPLSSNPKRRPGQMQWRQRLILARMGGTGPVHTVPLAPEPEEPAGRPIGEAVPDTAGPATRTAPPDTVAPPDTAAPPDTTRPRPRPPPPRPDTTSSRIGSPLAQRGSL